MHHQSRSAHTLHRQDIDTEEAGLVRCWRLGSLTVSASRVAIFCTSGPSREWSGFSDTDTPPTWSCVALVQLADIARYRMRHLLPQMTVEQENAFLASRTRVTANRPLGGIAQLRKAQKLARQTTAAPARVAS